MEAREEGREEKGADCEREHNWNEFEERRMLEVIKKRNTRADM